MVPPHPHTLTPSQLNLSHNLLQVLQLQYLSLPSLEKLSVAHNHIQCIQDDNKVRKIYGLSKCRLMILTTMHFVIVFIMVAQLTLSVPFQQS